jgi:hypothetical protein
MARLARFIPAFALVVDVTDGVGGDRAFGGRGTDRCIVDANDILHGCESVSVAP